jgi:uncharacterized protein (TIGR03435 family)
MLVADRNSTTVSVSKPVRGILVGIVASACLVVISSHRLLGQATVDKAGNLAFDVASVKPSQGKAPGFGGREPGRYTRWHLTLKVALQLAFKLAPYQVEGPGWINEGRFDVLGTMPASTTDDQVLMMLQTLLIERFKLKFHREQRILPVYALVMGKKPLRMVVAEGDAAPGFNQGKNGLIAKKRTMQDLAGLLMRWEDNTVIDMTGLTGTYDFDLNLGANIPDTLRVAAALDELGLKLEARKAPVEFLIIEGGQKDPIGN